jgi:hypothetical protein
MLTVDHKSSGVDQILAESIHTDIVILYSEVHKIIYSISQEEGLLKSGRILLYAFTRRAIKLTVVFNKSVNCYRLHTAAYQYCSLKFTSIPRRDYWGSSVWVST